MEFSEREKKIIVDLIAIAWQAGAVRSEEQASELKGIKLKAQAEDKKAE